MGVHSADSSEVPASKKRKYSWWGLFVLLVFLGYAILSAGRGDGVGADTAEYISYFHSLSEGAQNGYGRNLEYGFFLFTKLLALQPSHEIYLFVISLLVCSLISGLFVEGLTQRFAVLALTWFCYPFFYSVSLNVLRQGLAFGLIFTLVLTREAKLLRSLMYVLIATSMHYVAFPVGLLVLLAKRLRFAFAFAFWMVSVIFGVVAASYFSSLLGYVLDALPFDASYYADYISNASDLYETGFRIDFFSFSLIGVMISIFLIKIRNKSEEKVVGNLTVGNLAKIYLILNGWAYFFVMLPYSDRFFAWSWYLYPTFFLSLFWLSRLPKSVLCLALTPGVFYALLFLQWGA